MRQIELTKSKFAIVDDNDFASLSSMKWHTHPCKNDFYAATYINSKLRLMHELIMNPGMGQEIDHKNGNGLDNRRDNLRICTHANNMCNRRIGKNNKSGYKGVYFTKSGNAWRSKLRFKGRNINLGNFKKPIDAAIAYDNAAMKYFGEFARTNKDMGLLN